jgi:hypothetical protein
MLVVVGRVGVWEWVGVGVGVTGRMRLSDRESEGWVRYGWMDEWVGGWMDGWMDGRRRREEA